MAVLSNYNNNGPTYVCHLLLLCKLFLDTALDYGLSYASRGELLKYIIKVMNTHQY